MEGVQECMQDEGDLHARQIRDLYNTCQYLGSCMLWSYLCWVLAAEGAASVCAPAAVRIHNDFASSQSSVTNRATQDETAVHQVTAWHNCGHQLKLQQVFGCLYVVL
jgi:hypothetical protein